MQKEQRQIFCIFVAMLFYMNKYLFFGIMHPTICSTNQPTTMQVFPLIWHQLRAYHLISLNLMFCHFGSWTMDSLLAGGFPDTLKQGLLTLVFGRCLTALLLKFGNSFISFSVCCKTMKFRRKNMKYSRAILRPVNNVCRQWSGKTIWIGGNWWITIKRWRCLIEVSWQGPFGQLTRQKHALVHSIVPHQ